jgi:hypothetical protein
MALEGAMGEQTFTHLALDRSEGWRTAQCASAIGAA